MPHPPPPADVNAQLALLTRAVLDGVVVPVIGPGLITLDDGRPLSQHLAQDLINEFAPDLSADSVIDAARLVFDRRGEDLDQRTVKEFVRSRLLAHWSYIPKSLRDLAAVREFRTFLTTTVEPSLGMALQERAFVQEDVAIVAARLDGGDHGALGARVAIDGGPRRLVAHLFGTPQRLATDMQWAPQDGADFAVTESDIVDYLFGLPRSEFAMDVGAFVRQHEGAAANQRRTAGGVAGGGGVPTLLLLGVNLSPRLLPYFLKITSALVHADGTPSIGRARVAEMYAAEEGWLPSYLRAYAPQARLLHLSPSELVSELSARVERERPRAVRSVNSPADARNRAVVFAAAEDVALAYDVAEWMSACDIETVVCQTSNFNKAQREEVIENAMLCVPIMHSATLHQFEALPIASQLADLVLSGIGATKVQPLWCIVGDTTDATAMPSHLLHKGPAGVWSRTATDQDIVRVLRASVSSRAT